MITYTSQAIRENDPCNFFRRISTALTDENSIIPIEKLDRLSIEINDQLERSVRSNAPCRMKIPSEESFSQRYNSYKICGRI